MFVIKVCWVEWVMKHTTTTVNLIDKWDRWLVGWLGIPKILMKTFFSHKFALEPFFVEDSCFRWLKLFWVLWKSKERICIWHFRIFFSFVLLPKFCLFLCNQEVAKQTNSIMIQQTRTMKKRSRVTWCFHKMKMRQGHRYRNNKPR